MIAGFTAYQAAEEPGTVEPWERGTVRTWDRGTMHYRVGNRRGVLVLRLAERPKKVRDHRKLSRSQRLHDSDAVRDALTLVTFRNRERRGREARN